jgi:putative ABC transport system substrate-binding protein
MRRREFIKLLGGAAAAWPFAARSQQSSGTRRIGVLMNLPADDAEGQARVAAFLKGLSQFGWKDGSNIKIDYRWGHPDPDRIRRDAADLIELKPEVILSSGTPTVAALHVATSSIPIVFAQVVDPVGSGFVDSLARPGHNITGFSQFEYSFGGKWLELLKEIAPNIRRAAVLRDLALASGSGQFGAMQAVAPQLGVELSGVGLGSAGEIEHGIETFAGSGNGGLIVTASTLALDHRDLIIMLAARHRLPAVYSSRYFTTVGGLISYGANSIDPFRRAAAYVDRILRGQNTSDMPVQAPVKYELVINVKAANALGLSVPPSLLARADEVIE